MGKQMRGAVGGDKKCCDETQKGSNVRVVVREYHSHCILFNIYSIEGAICITDGLKTAVFN